MSLEKEYRLWCDTDGPPGCWFWTGTRGSTKEELRQEAARLGWTQIGGKDYCPACSEKKVPRP